MIERGGRNARPARPHLADSELQANTREDTDQRFQHRQKIEPAAGWLRAAGANDRPIADLKAKRKAPPPSRMATEQPQFQACFRSCFSVQTFMDFMPVSASVLVLNV